MFEEIASESVKLLILLFWLFLALIIILGVTWMKTYRKD